MVAPHDGTRSTHEAACCISRTLADSRQRTIRNDQKCAAHEIQEHEPSSIELCELTALEIRIQRLGVIAQRTLPAPFAAAVDVAFPLPDRRAVLHALDHRATGAERLVAMAAAGGDHDRGVADFAQASTVRMRYSGSLMK